MLFIVSPCGMEVFCRCAVGKSGVQKTEGSVLKQIREYNPLMLDFVLKRCVRVSVRKLSDSIYETGAFFSKNKLGGKNSWRKRRRKRTR